MSTEEKVIESVRKHPVLYDPNNPSYMKNKLKTRIWTDIAKELNLKDGEETKNVWLKLRGGYRDARRRQKKMYISGAPSQQIRPWKYQKQMSFLEPFMFCGIREGNIVDESDDETQLPPELMEIPQSENLEGTFNREERQRSCELFPEENVVIIYEENDGVEQPLFDDEGNHVDGRVLLSNTERPKSILAPPSKKKKQMDVRDILGHSLKQREDRARQRTEDRRKLLEESDNLKDPMYNFFMSMYQLTKNMPNLYQHQIRSKVFEAVSEAEAEIMNMTSNRPPSTSTVLSTASSAPNIISSNGSNENVPSIHHTNLIEESNDQTEQLFQNDPCQLSFNMRNFINNYKCD